MLTSDGWDTTRYLRTSPDGHPYHAHHAGYGWYVNYSYCDMPELYGPAWRVSSVSYPKCVRRLRGKQHLTPLRLSASKRCDCEPFGLTSLVWDHVTAWNVGGKPVTTAEPNCANPLDCPTVGCIPAAVQLREYADEWGLHFAVLPGAGRRSCRRDALVILSSVPVAELGLLP